MPPTLLISIPGQPFREIKLERDRYTLGRAPGNDIVIKNVVVSRQHGLLERNGDTWTYTNRSNTSGTRVDGQLVQKVTLHDGAQLQIGKDAGKSVLLSFRVEVLIQSQAAIQAGFPTSKPIDTILAGFPASRPVETMLAREESATGLIFLNEVQPKGPKAITIGRGADADIRLQSPAVSRHHARLLHSVPEWTLTDLNSTNGTFVNGQRVKAPVQMHPGDRIQMGPFRLNYEGRGKLRVFAASRGLRLDGQGLSVEVGSGESRKRILEGITISCYPQEFVGLVGGSGAGKTTLMKALSGLLHPHGRVLIEGEDLYHNYDAYRSQIGYVPQDDILHKELPVEQALRYSARLRLPGDVGDQEVESRVNKVLEQVELSGQRGQPIHSLSGGQRKRASIAVELLADPPLFFLDEPTSGLDPGLEKKMMTMLGKLADSGKTILLVTHATANITECDQVAFLSQGRMVYFGPPRQAHTFFEVGDNNFASIYDEISDPDPRKSKALAASWEERFKNSKFYQKYVAARFRSLPQPGKRTGGAAPRAARMRVNPLHQFLLLTRRYFDLILRDKILLTILLVIMPLLAGYLLIIADSNWLTGDTSPAIEQKLVEGLLGEKSSNYTVAGNGQALLFMMALASVLLGLFAAAYEIVKERSIYARERMVFLQLVPYLASKVVLLGSFAAVQCLLFLIVLSFKIHFPAQGVILPSFLEIYISLVLGAVAAILFGLLISAIAPNASSVSYIILGVMFIQILFAGVIFKLPGAAGKMSIITLSRWTTEALGVSADIDSLNDLSQTRFQPEDVTKDVNIEVAPGQTITKSVTVEPEAVDIETPLSFELNYERSATHLLSDWAMLIGLSLFLGACTIGALKRQDVVS